MKLHIIKLLVFLALMGGFYAFDGFERPVVAQDDYRSSRRMARAWTVTVLMFTAGAVMTLWGNAIAHQINCDIPDGVYPIIGGLLLVAGFVWMLMVKDSLRMTSQNEAVDRFRASEINGIEKSNLRGTFPVLGHLHIRPFAYGSFTR